MQSMQKCKTLLASCRFVWRFRNDTNAAANWEDSMQEIGHWINGKLVAGTSGRFADVMNPATGEVQARVALATLGELDHAIQEAAKAQVGWAATNPQRRARVMMAFGALINRDMDKLAELVAREHGKTIPDAKGDVQRGLEVIEVCMGAPAMLKGEMMDSAGPGIDLYAMRQPLGVVAGITPFNFPAMIPLWKIGPALSSGNAMILKPSERVPSTSLVPRATAARGGPAGRCAAGGERRQDVVDGILDHPVIQGVGFVGSTPIAQYIYGRAASERQAGAVLWRCQEPHDHHAGRRSGQGGGCAGRRRLRGCGRTLHGDFGRGAGG
jgi:malonate-semialdehyde dehydrogenase (acetylating)/methylmalonate-semialdehyde dehydrogenase